MKRQWLSKTEDWVVMILLSVALFPSRLFAFHPEVADPISSRVKPAVAVTQTVEAKPALPDPFMESMAPGALSQSDETVTGDVNQDGSLDNQDVTLILQHVQAIKEEKESPLSMEQQVNADVDGEEGLTYADAKIAKGMIEGVIPQGETAKLGDVNQDGKVSGLDGFLLLRDVERQKKGLPSRLTAFQKFVADLNDDGKVSRKDVYLVNRLVTKMVNLAEFPIQPKKVQKAETKPALKTNLELRSILEMTGFRLPQSVTITTAAN